MVLRFGVIAGGTGTATEKKLHLTVLTRTRTHQDDRNIQFLSTYKNKRKKIKKC